MPGSDIESNEVQAEFMLIECSFECVYCFQQNGILVDPSGGAYQEYIEDCQICCRPNRLQVAVNPERTQAHVIAQSAD